eukprot:TRINITY_DN41095_c0_g1_i1.p1 TRINITY_DN41095_c0_g1~~TRINITY_DN41095_c0_g1_i1.p1  ORF type:complete len:126 (+),score=30.85 TRINITY_DN41095_c0_g1_i1:45-422(+)
MRLCLKFFMCGVFFFFKQKTAYEMLRSLVGSEMCIRDRYNRGGVCSKHLTHRLGVGCLKLSVGQHDSLRVRPYLTPTNMVCILSNKQLDEMKPRRQVGPISHQILTTSGGSVSYTHLTLPTKRIV